MKEHKKEDKAYLVKLIKALDVSLKRLKRDGCNDWNIVGIRGHISTDQEYWYLYIECETNKKWTYTKKHLAFMEVHQDGDSEGILKLSRMPFREEARTVRKVIGLRPKTVLTEEGRAQLVRMRNTPLSEGVI